jgi:hypothetical protein
MLEEGLKKDQELDRIFSRDADLVPSSGFVSAVMEAVRMEASAPPPIPFPWKRALPGIAAWVLALTLLFLAAFRHTGESPAAPSTVHRVLASLAPAFRAAQAVGAGWILAALLLSYVSVKLAFLFSPQGERDGSG